MARNKQGNDNKDAQESGQPVQLDEEQRGGQHGAGQDQPRKSGGAQKDEGGAIPSGGEGAPTE